MKKPMTTRSCPKCSLLMARCDFKYCPDCGARLDSFCPSDATACSSSSETPETDSAWEKLCCSGQSWYQIAERLKLDCRAMERARNQLADEVAFAWKSKAKADDYIQTLKSRMNATMEARPDGAPPQQ